MVKILSVTLSLVGCIIGITDAASSAAYMVMASPRPWRLSKASGKHDPHDEEWKGTWKLRNNKVARQVERIASYSNALFGIVNGDLTEFGGDKQLLSTEDVYGRMKLRLYSGLGDRDYRDNVGHCGNAGELGMNLKSCAFRMVLNMDQLMDGYAKTLPNFRRDRWRPNSSVTPGSLAYSWDSSAMVDSRNITSHFVQLHLSPEYSTYLHNLFVSKEINVLPSFSWLWEDLYLARKRNVDYIFVNLHAKDRYLNSTTDWNKRKYAGILEQFKVDAVFAGDDDHSSMDIARDGLYKNIPVYQTGPLYDGYFAKLEVFKDGFQVTNYKYEDGYVKENVSEFQPSNAKPVWCKTEGQRGAAGDLYTTSLIQPGRPYYNLVSKATKRALDANNRQEVYTRNFAGDNVHQRWVIEPINKSVPPYETAYKIIHKETGKALDGNKDGNIYLRDWHGKDWQRWYIHKLNDDYVHWISEATKRSLDGNGAGKVYGSAGPRNFENSYQMWRLIDSTGTWTKVQYYKALTDDAWRHPLPSMGGNKQPYMRGSEYWKYVGEHRVDAAPPCIGW